MAPNSASWVKFQNRIPKDKRTYDEMYPAEQAAARKKAKKAAQSPGSPGYMRSPICKIR